MAAQSQADLGRRQAATQAYEAALQIAQSAYAGTVTAAFTALWSAYAGAVLTHNAAYAAAAQAMQTAR